MKGLSHFIKKLEKTFDSNRGWRKVKRSGHSDAIYFSAAGMSVRIADHSSTQISWECGHDEPDAEVLITEHDPYEYRGEFHADRRLWLTPNECRRPSHLTAMIRGWLAHEAKLTRKEEKDR